MKATWNTASFFATLMGILSVLLLWDKATDTGWILIIEDILVFYQSLKNLVLSPLLPYAEFVVKEISNLFSIDLILGEHWSDILVLVTLYLGARALSYWRAGMKRQSIFRVIWGALVGFATGMLAGVSESIMQFGNVVVIGAIVLGLAVFDFIDAAWSATFHRNPHLAWGQDWVRYLAFSMPTIVIGLVIIVISVATSIVPLAYTDASSGILTSLGYAIVLAFYWLYRGVRSSRSWEKSGTGYEKFLASSNTQIGLVMLRSLGGALIVVLFNAGFNSLIP